MISSSSFAAALGETAMAFDFAPAISVWPQKSPVESQPEIVHPIFILQENGDIYYLLHGFTRRYSINDNEVKRGIISYERKHCHAEFQCEIEGIRGWVGMICYHWGSSSRHGLLWCYQELSWARIHPSAGQLTTASRMEVGCRLARAINPWLAIPINQPWDPTHWESRHPSHWMTVENGWMPVKKKTHAIASWMIDWIC